MGGEVRAFYGEGCVDEPFDDDAPDLWRSRTRRNRLQLVVGLPDLIQPFIRRTIVPVICGFDFVY